MATLQWKLWQRDAISFVMLWLASVGLLEVVATSQISIPSLPQIIAGFLLGGGAYLLAVLCLRAQFLGAWASPLRVAYGVTVLCGTFLLVFAGGVTMDAVAQCGRG